MASLFLISESLCRVTASWYLVQEAADGTEEGGGVDGRAVSSRTWQRSVEHMERSPPATHGKGTARGTLVTFGQGVGVWQQLLRG